MKSRSLVLSVLTLLPLAGCKERGEKLTQLPAAETATQQAEVVSVTVVPVKRENVSRSVLATGTSEPVRDANLSPQMTGRIASIHVKEGDKVKAGAVLAQLDSMEASLRVEQTTASAASSRSQYELAKAEYDRLAPLAERGTVTAQQLQRLAGQRDALKSAADATQVMEADAKRHVTNTSIRAPFSGVISKVHSEVGEVATMMPVTVIVRLVDLSSVDVRVPVHERELARIAIGNRVVASFPSISASAEGKVTFISPEIDPKTRSAEVVTRIPNPESKFRAGMFTEISIDPKGTQESLVVPKGAVGGTGDNRYVYVVNGEVVEQRKVRVSAVDAESMEVLEGLKLDEPVVREGIGRLSDGVRVKLTEAAEIKPAAEVAPTAVEPAEPAQKVELSRGAKP
jgi:RND family efflux transporter MFP subunit